MEGMAGRALTLCKLSHRDDISVTFSTKKSLSLKILLCTVDRIIILIYHFLLYALINKNPIYNYSLKKILSKKILKKIISLFDWIRTLSPLTVFYKWIWHYVNVIIFFIKISVF